MRYGSKQHEEKISAVAKELEKQGFTTLPIRKRIPDAVAFKGQFFLIEVTSSGREKMVRAEYEDAYGENVPLRVISYEGEDIERLVSYFPHHSWTHTDVKFVMEKRQEGWTFPKIAKELGLRPSQVRGKYYDLLG